MHPAHYQERRIDAPEGKRNGDYFQRYVWHMRRARLALDAGNIARASWRVSTALMWRDLSKMGKQAQEKR